jgi:N-methylhydantoinase A/oxoprolinase/acetone carboxylase beta subunit
MEKIYIIACSVLAKDIEQAVGQLGLSAGTEFLPGGLHERPDQLRQRLQDAIDRASGSGAWDRIAVGYGVCGRGTVGIQAKKIPLSIPRVHDCISLFLGGDREYQAQFRRYPGTFYITEGWFAGKSRLEKDNRPYAWMGNAKVYFDELVDQYGAKHAKETFKFLNSWRSNYQRAVYIDTGLGNGSDRARQHAITMAAENNWAFEELNGNQRLLKLLLTAAQSTPEILVASPGHVLFFDALGQGLSSKPQVSGDTGQRGLQHRVEIIDGSTTAGAPLQLGLGIDTGGTYTDAVIFDFNTESVRCKCKALTTRWDFTVGIGQSLTGLDKVALKAVQLVSISTTLATNALIENDGQKVGLLIMAPRGLSRNCEIIHSPQALLSAAMDITGKELFPVNERQIQRIGRWMVDQIGVEAFAISGYAGSINPEHELRTKQILQEVTGKFVSCGHELSQLLNFRVRAETAVHNARIVPLLNRLMDNISCVLKELGITAPVMVVRGDGTLMKQALAQERAVETILSGPAASVAGVRFLTKADTAIIVDMGGTTTDIALLENGRVHLCEQGARVGSARTHVKALKIHTTGLGGDSLIACHQGKWLIGPRRVAPLAWLGSQVAGLDKAMDHLRKRKELFKNASQAMPLFMLNQRAIPFALTELEERIVALTAKRPRSLDELAQRTDSLYPGSLPLERLESHHILQRCGLTPTDLLHVTRDFVRWDAEASRQMIALLADTVHMSERELVSLLLQQIVQRLSMELLADQIETFHEDGTRDSCATGRRLIANLHNDGQPGMTVSIALPHPLVGVGAPVGHFLPRVADLLGTHAIVPPEHDVANAIGAITSIVRVEHEVTITPAPSGQFYLQGIAGNLRFIDLGEAEMFAKKFLLKKVREMAHDAGTRQSNVTMTYKDEVTETSFGDAVFLGRHLVARIEGRPDRFS